MQPEKSSYTTIDAYIELFTPAQQEVLQKVRETIRAAVPTAKEKISWQMPTFDLHGNVIHFAAAKNHLGIYPGASGVQHFLPKLKEYKTSKGAIQFPYAKPIPYRLIAEIAQFRAAENVREAEEKAAKKKK